VNVDVEVEVEVMPMVEEDLVEERLWWWFGLDLPT